MGTRVGWCSAGPVDETLAVPEMSDVRGTLGIRLPQIVSRSELESLAKRTGLPLGQAVLDPYAHPGSFRNEDYAEKHDTSQHWIPMPMPPRPSVSTVWHYTNSAGALGVIRSSEVWATSVNLLNDSDEFIFGIKMLRDQLDTVLRSRHVHPDQKSFMEEAVRQAATPDQLGLFVFCASEKKDSLSQWRAYGDDVGYAVGLAVNDDIMAVVDEQHPPRRMPNVPPWPTWGKVLYKKKQQRELLMRGLSYCAAAAPVPGGGHEEVALSLREASGVLTSLSMYCKNAAFSDEREVRLVATSSEEASGVEFRPSRYGVAPYVRLTQPPSRKSTTRAWWTVKKRTPLPISEVLVGPTAHPQAAAHGVQELLAARGYGAVPVTVSTAPLRSR